MIKLRKNLLEMNLLQFEIQSWLTFVKPSNSLYFCRHNFLMAKLKNYKNIIRLAIPIILANASAPLLGLADTATIGQTAHAAELGAISLAALVFSFVYWGFGFLRMGTTGFIAQAKGKSDPDEVLAVLFRSVILGLGIGVLMILLQYFIG